MEHKFTVMRLAVLAAILLQRSYGFGLEVPSALINNVVGASNAAIDTATNVFSSARIPADRSNLVCENCLKTNPIDQEKCCACNYELKLKTKNLLIEYIGVLGENVVLIPAEDVNSTWFEIEHFGGYLGSMPSNFCHWESREKVKDIFEPFISFDINDHLDKVLKINFDSNQIRSIPDLNCLSNLDTLQLRYNKVEHLSNTSFANLTKLRVVDLGYNSIKTMDSTIFTNPQLHLTRVDLQGNSLTNLDVSNCISLYPFCRFDYRDNDINQLTNVKDYTLDPHHTYGPGMVDFTRNSFQTFPNLVSLLHLDSIQVLGRLLECGFDFTDVPLICDGWMEPYLEAAREMPEPFWHGYLDVKCAGPENLKGRTIADIVYHDDMDKLVTNYTCYQDCKCQDRPSQDYVYIDCSGQQLTDLSKGQLPNPQFCENIHLNISNNSISIITNITDLDKVTVLDISNNDIVHIATEAAQQMENITYLNLADNPNLKSMPEQLRYLNSCNINLGGNVLTCDCELLWMFDWSNKNTCPSNETMNLCFVPKHGIISMDDFHKDLLDCKPEENNFFAKLATVLAILLLTIILAFIVIYYLRYEVSVIILRLRRRKKTQITPSFIYDAYISFDEENDLLRNWVNTELVPQLEGRGYRNFLTYRDIAIGDIRDNIVIDVLTHTRNFVLILSQSYFDQDGINWSELEWKHGWNMYKDNKLNNIVLVNFDHVSSVDVDHPQIKAFLRVGGQVTFTNQNRDIMQQISIKLGPPSTQKSVSDRGFVNEKPKLDITSLFCVETIESNTDHKNFGEIDANYENVVIKYKYIGRLDEVIDTNDEHETNAETEKDRVIAKTFNNSGITVLDTQAKPVFNMKYLQEDDITLTTL